MNEDLKRHTAAWLNAGDPVAVATIVRIRGSSSQPLGARMVMTTGNRFAGAVSGGCVETDVYEAGMDVLDNDRPLMLHYKKVENPLVEIGLNCDGHIDVLVERLDRALFEQLTAPAPYVRVTWCAPNQPLAPEPRHANVTLTGEGGEALPEHVRADAIRVAESDRPQTVSYPDGRIALLEPVLPPPLLLIFGAEPVAGPLARLAHIMGFRVVVSDARPAFATRENHPDADEVIAAWPAEVIQRTGIDGRTFVVSLNHEPRFEDALLHALAGHRPAYLGAIGKRQRHAERVARAEAAGFDLSQLPPIHTPVGLDLGGKTPEEIALSIIAQVVAVKNGRKGVPLSATNRP